MTLCECGCGLEAKPGNRFIHGHNQRNKKHTPKSRELMSKNNGMKRKENSSRFEGDNNPMRNPEVVAKISGGNHWTRRLGISEESRNRMSVARMGTDPWNKGKRCPEISERQMGEKNHMFGKVSPLKGVKRPDLTGENANAWKGGISFEPYCPKFTERFKHQIRDHYDNCDFFSGLPDYICNVVNGKVWKLDVHHIDYNKNQGCEGVGWKLVPLSRKNHAKTHGNRSFWKRLICYALEYDKTYYDIKLINIMGGSN